jgi:hypothetical protein
MIAVESDRISCLPDHIVHHIFSHLPIKDAGRTSVLSRKWRKKWSTQPDLVFDIQCASVAASKNRSIIESKFLRIIDHVLLLHSGPINKFKVTDSGYYVFDMNSMADIDRWILHLTGRSIKKLVLDIQFKQPYKIPSCLFSCQSLYHLQLFCCLVKPPTTFEGLMNLKILDLEKVTVAQDTFENLISGCPLLEKLLMNDLHGFTQINIHAPNLKFFAIIGEFEGISFNNNTSQLTTVILNLSLYLNFDTSQSRLHGCSNNLLKFFDHQPNIENLMILSYFIKV